jgi:hypothetical protein
VPLREARGVLPPPHLHASRPPPSRFPAASQLTSQLVPVPSYLLQAATTAATDATRGSAAKDAEISGLQHGWWRRQERLTGIAVDSSARQLCTRCAEASGAKASRRPNVSMEAAGFFAMLAEVGGATVEHERWDVDARCWVGREVEGLVAPWHDRPDGVERNASGRVRRCWFYHGSSVHGYPPHHPLHTSTLSRTGELASVAWARTLASMQRFVAFGYEVRYVCSYEYDAFWRVRESRRRPREELLSIVHML